MPKVMNIDASDGRLRDLALRAGENPEPCFLEVDGRRLAVVMAAETYESLLETLEIESDEELAASIRRGMADVAEGRTKPAAEAMAEIRARRRAAS